MIKLVLRSNTGKVLDEVELYRVADAPAFEQRFRLATDEQGTQEGGPYLTIEGDTTELLNAVRSATRSTHTQEWYA